jgi:hypothetical protein
VEGITLPHQRPADKEAQAVVVLLILELFEMIERVRASKVSPEI